MSVHGGAAGGGSAARVIPVRDALRSSEEQQRALAAAARLELAQQLENEARLLDIFRRILADSHEDLAGCLRDSLAALAEIAAADRARLYLVRPRRLGGPIHHTWSRGEGAEPVEHTYEQTGFAWAAAQLAQGQPFHVPSVAELPESAAEERRVLSSRGARSYLAIPILRGGRPDGFVDFSRTAEERAWAPREIARLALVTEAIGSAVARRRAERSRIEAEERLRTLAHHTCDMICELSLDGRLLFVSDGAERICGYGMCEFIEGDPWSFVHPEDVTRVQREAHRARASGGGPPITYRIRHRDGRWPWVEATINRFETRDGELRLAVVVRDVDERQRQRLDLEHQLRGEQRMAGFARSLLEAGQEQLDQEISRGLEVAAGLAGADRTHLVTSLGGADGSLSVYAWQAPGVPARDHAAIARDRQAWLVDRLRRGETISISDVDELPEEAGEVRESLRTWGIRSYLCLPILAEGRLKGAVGFHSVRARSDWSERDLTLLRLAVDLLASALRRKGAEASLEESQLRLLQAQKMEAVGTLAGGIAHDFNNQLTVMLSNARYARRETAGDEEVTRALEDLERAAGHCAQLTHSLLAFSRRSPAAPRSLEVRSVVEEAKELLRPLIPSSIAFEVHSTALGSRILVDPTQLQQVLVNLVINARDAMPNGGRISLHVSSRWLGAGDGERLGLSSPGTYVEFLVRDTGSGMDEEVRARVFEPFFTTKPVGEGTGLGLATAYGIVEQSGGVIEVESAPGRGSTFRVLLPHAAGEGDAAVVETEGASQGGAGTLLLVEDEPSVRHLVARTLRDAGYEVIEALDGAEGLRLGRQQLDRVSAVVTDVDMPRLGGVELARRLSTRRPDLPVLFISGLSPGSLPADALGTAAARRRFLSKPFTESGLLERLQQLLRPS